jgi:hypothetical protein
MAARLQDLDTSDDESRQRATTCTGAKDAKRAPKRASLKSSEIDRFQSAIRRSRCLRLICPELSQRPGDWLISPNRGDSGDTIDQLPGRLPGED